MLKHPRLVCSSILGGFLGTPGLGTFFNMEGVKPLQILTYLFRGPIVY